MYSVAVPPPGPVLATILDSTGVLVGLAAVVVLLALWAWLNPGGLLRLALKLITHSVYWMRRFGTQNVPAQGGALVVCTPLSYLDWLLIWSAIPRRARLVVLAGWAGRPRLRRLLRWTGAIVVDATSTPRDVVKALHEARAALGRGEA